MIKYFCCFFFFKQKTAYEIVDCDWSSDVCSSDLIKFSVVLLMANLLIVFSCQRDEELLEIDNPNNPTPDTFFQNESDALLGLNAVYAAWQSRNLAQRFYFFGNDMPSDESIGTNNLQAVLAQMLNYTWDANNGVISGMWGDYYTGIGRANRVIQQVPEIEMDEAEQRQQQEALDSAKQEQDNEIILEEPSNP